MFSSKCKTWFHSLKRYSRCWERDERRHGEAQPSVQEKTLAFEDATESFPQDTPENKNRSCFISFSESSSESVEGELNVKVATVMRGVYWKMFTAGILWTEYCSSIMWIFCLKISASISFLTVHWLTKGRIVPLSFSRFVLALYENMFWFSLWRPPAALPVAFLVAKVNANFSYM